MAWPPADTTNISGTMNVTAGVVTGGNLIAAGSVNSAAANVTSLVSTGAVKSSSTVNGTVVNASISMVTGYVNAATVNVSTTIRGTGTSNPNINAFMVNVANIEVPTLFATTAVRVGATKVLGTQGANVYGAVAFKPIQGGGVSNDAANVANIINALLNIGTILYNHGLTA